VFGFKHQPPYNCTINQPKHGVCTDCIKAVTEPILNRSGQTLKSVFTIIEPYSIEIKLSASQDTHMANVFDVLNSDKIKVRGKGTIICLCKNAKKAHTL
jgi:hypothetical protein